ncbi:hypothetical protein TI39_contig685g00008 [Zymoseptoria brevis]|uniref:Uncharacterized protein n=1 Tax=Zymoseptoria brevis TaxID=1047168 RepID=A0A0F4GG69_9PEZI|nr:hypothetical protein TI39_contig685g00008 [Zymoseptoria brevis]
MDDLMPSPPAPNILKRAAPEHEHDRTPDTKPLNLKGSQFVMPTPPDTDGSSNTSPDVSINNDDRERGGSPAPSSALSSIGEVDTGDASSIAGPSTTTTRAGGPPPAKKRKSLTPAEKLEQAQVKEAKAREKAEKQAQKEEEKARKDEEKRVKDEERRKLAEEKEAKKREKELEVERKAQEKLNKERKQMRLGAFFQAPATPAKADDGDETQAGRTRRKSLSLEPYDAVAERIRAASPMKGTPPPASAKKSLDATPTISDYHKTFLPFDLPTYSVLAPLIQTSDDAQERFDHELNDPSLKEKYDLGIEGSYAGLTEYFADERSRTRGIPVTSVRELAEAIEGTSKVPIDLTEDGLGVTALDVLRRIPIRHLQFHEDVRPAYCGTYTKIKSPRTTTKMRRNPFTRARKDTNYDYDSEVEWEEPEEGDEEVLSEEEEEADSQVDADEIDGFLDDENDTAKVKRKITTGELVPETTGLCWESKANRICVVESIETDQQPPAMSGMRMGWLIAGFAGATIDPFSTAYWQDAPSEIAGPTLMAPPRAPLQPRLDLGCNAIPPGSSLIGAAEGQKGPITSLAASQGARRGPKPAPKTLNKEDLEEFKEAVVGSPLGKLELQKGLKTRFPKLTHDAIKETLGTLFAQRGLGKADKKWVFVGNS